jgi:mono/diheme cytochrome c family protein
MYRLLAMILGFFGERFQKIILVLYVMCLITTIGLGYFGGEIVYGKTAAKRTELGDVAAKGAEIFKNNCAACHLADSTATKIGPGLMGVFQKNKFPISGNAAAEANFRSLLKKPVARTPPFGHLPGEEVDALIEYLRTL